VGTDGKLVVYDNASVPIWDSSWTSHGLLQHVAASPPNQCQGRCGSGCNGWMPFGGSIYTSACSSHDACVAAHGHLACAPLFVPAAVSYLATVGRNIISAGWNAVSSIFGF
jgi:hypothetical protein